jgi:hypothetical protein
MAMVGAGPLTSAIWKLGDEQGGWRYRFNLFRQLAGSGHVSQLFQPSDLTYFVKLTQVLAAVLARKRKLLRQLAAELDEVMQRLDNGDTLPGCEAPHRSLRTARKDHHGNAPNS